MKKLFYKNIVIKYLLVFILSIFTRFHYLGTVPVSLSHDEIDITIQAHSVIQTGSDIEGSWKPWAFLPNSGVMAELGPLISVPALSFLPNSLFSAHATSAFLSSLYPLLIVSLLLCWGWGSAVAWLSGLLLAISPWHIFFSRTALEQPTSLFFYTLSWIFLTKIFKKSTATNTLYPILYTLFFVLTYTLGFYTYHGYKFALPILTLIIAGYLTLTSKSIIRWKLVLIPTLLIVLLLGRTYMLRAHYNSRGGEIILLDSNRISSSVNAERQNSIAPEILQKVFSNKIIAFGDTLKDKYLESISPSHIFSKGDTNGVFSTGSTGYLYLISFPFLLIGIASLIFRGQKIDYLMLILTILSPLSTIIHTNSDLAFRSGIYFVFLTILTAIGVIKVFQHLQNRWFWIGISLIFISSFARFMYVYLYIHPVVNSTAYFFNERLLGRYLRLTNAKVLVLDMRPRYIMGNYILNNPTVGANDIASFDYQYSVSEYDKYQIGNITIQRDCPDSTDLSSYDTVIVETKQMTSDLAKCSAIAKLYNSPNLDIVNLVAPKDSGALTTIIGDRLCTGISLSNYVHPTSLQAFALDRMDSVQFCNNWIVRH